MHNKLLHKIALSYIPFVGVVLIKKLVAYTGNVEGIFTEKKQNLLKIPGIGKGILQKFNPDKALQKAEKQLKLVEKEKIDVLFYLDENYPKRLLECVDAPILLYQKGKTDFNIPKIISIVGTRNASDYGKNCCEKLIQGIKSNGHNALIVSGLAYGIDIAAHKAALKNKLPTVAVMGCGLEKIYPSLHSKYTKQIIENDGAMVSEFFVGSILAPQNFVQRNRIIAGMADATIVVESGIKGGSMLTAGMANSYNREVFAFPGAIYEKRSLGCNFLIKKNAARLIESVADLEYVLGWKAKENKKIQKKLFVLLSHDEKKIFNVLKDIPQMHIDQICRETNFPMNKAASLLLKLEFDGVVKNIPGKNYAIKT